MKYPRYLKEHAGWLFIWLFLVTTIEILLLTINGSLTLKIYVLATITICVFIGTYIDYRKVNSFISNLNRATEMLDKKYLLPETLDSFNTQEEKLIGMILGQMEHSMADNVAEFRRKSDDYKDYIETWVHEIKIPIATAGMIVENHKNELVKDVGIDTEIGRIQNYVEQALFFARSEAVEKDYIIKEVDLEEIAGSVIFDKKKILREKKASVDIHDMSSKAKVLSDGKWLSFVMSQIIDNSIKYAKENELLSLEIFVTEEDKKVFLHIKDNGVGMKKSEISRVFDKGFTGTNGRNVSSSTGMGLYLCKKLCNRLEHDIVVKSMEDEGTDMIIVF